MGASRSSAIDRVAVQLYEAALGPVALADEQTIRSLLREASEAAEASRFSERFLETEWHGVVDAWQLSTWESYRDVARLGRKTRLGENQRALLWSIFERVRSGLTGEGSCNAPGSLRRGLPTMLVGGGESPYDFIVIDESQDISMPQLRLLAALRGECENGLFFAGDLGQADLPNALLVVFGGASMCGGGRTTLRINYRTSHQIRHQADRLLPAEMSDVDGNTEERRGTVSAFNGPLPTVKVLESVQDETATIAGWIDGQKAGMGSCRKRSGSS